MSLEVVRHHQRCLVAFVDPQDLFGERGASQLNIAVAHSTQDKVMQMCRKAKLDVVVPEYFLGGDLITTEHYLWCGSRSPHHVCVCLVSQVGDCTTYTWADMAPASLTCQVHGVGFRAVV